MTLAQLITELEAYLDRTDISDAQFYNFINLGIKMLERKYNFKHMKVRYEQSLSDGDYAFNNPITNYKELKNAHIIDSNGYRYPPLMRGTQEQITNLYPDYDDNKGRPLYIADITTVESSLTPDALPTSQWLVRPTADDSYTLEINAYQYSIALDGSTYTTNWWTQNAWEIALYITLREAETFGKNYAGAEYWDKRLREPLSDLIKSEIDEKISGSSHNIIRSKYVNNFNIDYA